MQRVNASEAAKMKGKNVFIGGWIQESRDLGGLKFLLLRDWTGTIQVTAFKKTTEKKLFDLIGSFTKESVIEVQGKVQEAKQAPNGIEVIPERIELIAKAEMPTPIDLSGKIDSDLSVRLDWRSIDLRMPKNLAVIKIEASLVKGMQEWLNENKFLQIFTPCLMGSSSESGAEVFEVKYYNKKAFLRQDPQLHRQLAIAAGIEKLYDLGPSWRAELSFTAKHLCEHRAIAVEEAFIKDELDTERTQEQLVIAGIKKVKEECKKELELLGVEVKIPKAPFPELRFPEIYDILEKKGKKLKSGSDLDSEADKILWDYVKEKFDAEFYFFDRFPFEAKPFYVMRVDSDNEWCRSVDLNCKGMELSSGGQREHRHEKIMEQIKLKGMNEKSLEWFTKFFKYGVPSHGGFAVGIERLTKQLLNLENIREATLFPRDPERLLP